MAQYPLSVHEGKTADVPYPDTLLSNQEVYEMGSPSDIPPEPVKARSTFRIFAIMAALFVSGKRILLNSTAMI